MEESIRMYIMYGFSALWFIGFVIVCWKLWTPRDKDLDNYPYEF